MSAVAIVGAGPVARATAAWLVHHGHAAALWSPTGVKTAPLVRALEVAGRGAARRGLLKYSGVLRGEAEVGIIHDPAELSAHAVVLLALPGNAYPVILPRILPCLHARQTVIFSGALSLAPLWLYERAGLPGARPVVAAWGTTLATARMPDADGVHINTVRAGFEVAAVPAAARDAVLGTCRHLFGDRFTAIDSILAAALLNVNPVAHAAEVLPNLTRIEKKEHWPLFEYLTPAAGRIGEAVDAERQAIARGFGFEVRSIHQHTHLSYHVPVAGYAEMAAAIQAKSGSSAGPTTLEHRYFVEDVPYGLVFYESLARIVAVPAPNISAAITLFSTAYGRDFRKDNRLLDDLALAHRSPAELLRRCAGG